MPDSRRHATTRALVAGAILACIVAVAAGCGSGSSDGSASSGGGSKPPAKLQDVSIAWGTNDIFYAPSLFAYKLGYFKDEGLNVKQSFVAGGVAAVQRVVSGDADIGLSNLQHAAEADAQGAKVQYIASELDNLGVLIAVSDSWWKSHGMASMSTWQERIKAMDGVKLVTPAQGSGAEFLIKHLMQQVGLDPSKSVHLTAIADPSAEIAALKRGAVDAIAGPPTQLETTVSQGFGHIVAGSSDAADLKGLLPNGAVVNASWAAQHADIVRHVLAAIQRGNEYLKKNEAGSVSLARELFPQLPANVTKQTVRDRRALSPDCIKVDIPKAEASLTLLAKQKLVPPSLDAKDVVTDAYGPSC